jgi:hypothetical protein
MLKAIDLFHRQDAKIRQDVYGLNHKDTKITEDLMV